MTTIYVVDIAITQAFVNETGPDVAQNEYGHRGDTVVKGTVAYPVGREKVTVSFVANLRSGVIKFGGHVAMATQNELKKHILSVAAAVKIPIKSTKHLPKW